MKATLRYGEKDLTITVSQDGVLNVSPRESTAEFERALDQFRGLQYYPHTAGLVLAFVEANGGVIVEPPTYPGANPDPEAVP